MNARRLSPVPTRWRICGCCGEAYPEESMTLWLVDGEYPPQVTEALASSALKAERPGSGVPGRSDHPSSVPRKGQHEPGY